MNEENQKEKSNNDDSKGSLSMVIWVLVVIWVPLLLIGPENNAPTGPESSIDPVSRFAEAIANASVWLFCLIWGIYTLAFISNLRTNGWKFESLQSVNQGQCSIFDNWLFVVGGWTVLGSGLFILKNADEISKLIASVFFQ